MGRQWDEDIAAVTHEEVISPVGYRAIKEGRRRFHYRRGGIYRAGDRLHVREYGPEGREMQLHVTDVVRIPVVGESDDLVIMSIVPDLMEGSELV